MKTRLILSFFMLFPFLLNAEHTLGGFMTYTYDGANHYTFELRHYRDCNSGGANFDNPASVTIYRSEDLIYGHHLLDLDVFIFGQIEVISAVEDDCMNNSFPFCIEQATYFFEASLPPLPEGESYHVIYQRCCKSLHFSNIWSIDEIGITITSEITYDAYQLQNSGPALNPSNFFKVCVGEEFSFDISAADVDDHDLIYELCRPITGGGLSGTNGDPGSPNSCSGPQPIPACPPPFSPVNFIAPTYSVEEPLGTNSTLELDSETGEISGVANIVGQFLVGVCVKEYHNDTLISESHQDLVFRADFFLNDEEPELEQLAIFPNPAWERVYIELPDENESYELIVRDLNGRTIQYFTELRDNIFELPVQNLKGLYFLELRSSNQSFFEKVVVY